MLRKHHRKQNNKNVIIGSWRRHLGNAVFWTFNGCHTDELKPELVSFKEWTWESGHPNFIHWWKKWSLEHIAHWSYWQLNVSGRERTIILWGNDTLYIFSAPDGSLQTCTHMGSTNKNYWVVKNERKLAPGGVRGYIFGELEKEWRKGVIGSHTVPL